MPCVRRLMRTSGVLPTRSMTELAIFMRDPRTLCGSAESDNSLKIFSRNGHAAVGGGVELPGEAEQVFGERGLLDGIERAERLVDRPVVGAERVQPVLRRAVAEDEVALRDLQRGDAAAEQLA